MDPVSALGMTTSVFAVMGLATKILHTLDTLLEKWNKASERIVALQTQVASFKGSLNTLYEWMKNDFEPDENSDSFLENLSISIEGCSRLLGALAQKTEMLAVDPRRVSKMDKINLLWTESGIKDIIYYLNCQATPLILLLQCRTLAQQRRLLAAEENQEKLRKMADQTSQMRRIQDQSEDAQEETMDTLSMLLQNQDFVPIEESINSAIYAEKLNMLYQESPLSSQSTSTVPNDDSKKPKHQKLSHKRQSASEEYESIKHAVIGQHRVLGQKVKSTAKSIRFPLFETVGETERNRPSDQPAHHKFRILILGQAGVGKSKLCSRVLGLTEDEAGVSHRRIGTPISKIWEEMKPRSNTNVLIHDSGGFEAESEMAMLEIKKFLDFRNNQERSENQLHCIWYCISCSSKRPIQKAEIKFFQKFDPGPIPVVIVFTQYDESVDRRFLDWQYGSDAKDSSQSEGRKLAVQRAFHDYMVDYKNEILKHVKKSMNISICRTGFQGDIEYTDETHSERDPIGTSVLIAQTLGCLDNERLRSIWMVAQRGRADYFLKVSVRRCIHNFWTVQKKKMVPVPLIGIISITGAYSAIIRTLTEIWQIKTEPTDLTFHGLLSASFGVSSPAYVFNALALSYDVLGPLTGSLTAKIILKIIVGCTLIFESLYWRQMQEDIEVEPIRAEDIEHEASVYCTGLQRVVAAMIIEDSISLRNCFSQATARRVVEQAIAAAKKN